MSRNKSKSNNGNDERSDGSAIAETPNDNIDSSRAVQLEDLDLGNPVDFKCDELLEDVEDMLSQEKSTETEVDRNPLEHVDAISRRIEALTASLRQPINSCDCHEAAERMIEIDARLARLQNDFKKQSGRGDKLESGLELIDILANRIESLTDVVKLSVMEDEVKEDYNVHFDELKEQLQGLQKSLGDRPDHAEEIAAQTEAVQVLGSRLAEWFEKARQESEFQDLNSRLDEIATANAGRFDSLENRIQSLIDEAGQSEQLDALAEKVDSLTTLVDQSEHFDNLQDQISSLDQTISENDKLTGIHKQLESLSDFVKLGALENDHFDPSRIDDMAEQIKAIGQMLVEGNTDSGDRQSSEQVAQLNATVESLIETIENNPGSDSSISDKSAKKLAEKMESLEKVVQDNAGAAGSGESGTSPRIDELSEKLDAVTSLLERRGDSSGSFDGEIPDYNQQIQALAEKLEQTQATISSLAGSLVPLVESLQNGGGVSAASSDDGLSEWEKQKQAILAGYGVSGEKPVEPRDEEEQPAPEPEEAVSEPTDSRPEISTPEIEELRAQLEEKLRRAEIDISIERAKIHQERRDLEEMQSELDRQQAKINTHSSNSDSSGDNDGGESPGRWSRFLGN